ncbi:hypothetical protein [Ralstonia phage RP13]|nr:hypothetical protein [Ralstonia phage RP13]
MRNLAGHKECDMFIIDELTNCGISLVKIEPGRSEVPYSVIGELDFNGNKFTFKRAWYYWMVSGRVPLTVAQELYKTPVGKNSIRVAGHCGCPAPVAPWITWRTSEDNQVIPVYQEAQFKDFVERKHIPQEVMDKYVFSDTPEKIATPYIESYHIDTELGLYIFVEAIKKHFSSNTQQYVGQVDEAGHPMLVGA